MQKIVLESQRWCEKKRGEEEWERSTIGKFYIIANSSESLLLSPLRQDFPGLLCRYLFCLSKNEGSNTRSPLSNYRFVFVHLCVLLESIIIKESYFVWSPYTVSSCLPPPLLLMKSFPLVPPNTLHHCKFNYILLFFLGRSNSNFLCLIQLPHKMLSTTVSSSFFLQTQMNRVPLFGFIVSPMETYV